VVTSDRRLSGFLLSIKIVDLSIHDLYLTYGNVWASAEVRYGPTTTGRTSLDRRAVSRRHRVGCGRHIDLGGVVSRILETMEPETTRRRRQPGSS
jgi:hypothetical protein